jgi:hypothetical protein
MSVIHSVPSTYVAHVPRLPVPNRHITGQGHYRTPQRHS